MSKIKVVTDPEEVYFAKTTQYTLEVDGTVVLVRYVEDSNGAEVNYWNPEGEEWSDLVPQVIADLGWYFQDWLIDDLRPEAGLKAGQVYDTDDWED